MEELTWSSEHRGDATQVAMSGAITERAKPSALLDDARRHVVIDLFGIRRINSSGVREWVDFVRALEESGRTLTLERCSVAVVSQLNRIAAFRGGGHVRSIMAPYLCADCGAEAQELVSLPTLPATLAPTRPCKQCGGQLEFDDVSESYLAFARAMPGAER